MPSSRSRKRDSTLQTLNILNNVGSANPDPNANANASPNTRPRVLPPRRKLHAVSRAQEPRSDGIWNIPKSPEKRRGDAGRERVGVSEPITPRRSTRIRETGSSGGGDDKVMTGSGGRRSLRSTRGVDCHESEEAKEGESDEEGEDEDNDGDEQEREEEEEDDEEQEIRLFSDDEPEATKRPNTRSLRKSHGQSDDKEFPSFLSPTALFNGQVPSSDDEPDEPNDPNDPNESNETNTGQEESGGSEAEQSNAEELGEAETYRPSESRNWRHPPTPVVEIRLPPSSPHKPRSSPPVQEMRRDQAERESDESEWEDEQSFDNAVNGEQSSNMGIPHRPESSPAEQEVREDYIEREVERESDDSESEEEQSAHNAVDEGERSSRSSIPHRPRSSQEQEMHSVHTDGESESESDDSSEENSVANEAQRAGNARLRSLLAELETRRNRTQREPDEPEPQEEQLPDDTVNDGGESISSFQPEDEQDSSSSSPEPSDADEEDFPQRQPRKRRRVERYSPGITQPQKNRNSMFVTEESGESESEESGVSNNEEDEAERAAAIAEEEEQARKLQWMEKAMRLGGQRVNWLILTRTARELKQLVDPALAESFVDIWTTIRVLSRLYGERGNRPSDMTLRKCDNLFGSIRCEGERLLDQAYHLAVRPDGARDEVHACDLVDEFEARVIPEMVKLVFACFKAYYTDADMFPGIHEHFRRVLVLLRQLCDRTTSMKMQRIVHGTVRCKELGRALNVIIKALDSRDLRRRKSARSYSSISDRAGQDGSRGSIVIEDDSGREWSQDEGLALIDGLRAYQGMFPLCHMAHKSTDTTRA